MFRQIQSPWTLQAKRTTAKYLHRVRQVLKSELRTRSEPSTHSHSTWSKEEIGATDCTVYEEKKAARNALRVSPQVQHPETLHKARASELQIMTC